MDPTRTRRILALASPIVGGMISQNVLNLVDTAMVGSLGKAALAAVGIASFAFFMSFSVLTGLSSAVQAMASRRLGEGRPEEAAMALHGGLAAAVVVGLPLALGLWFVAPGLFDVLQSDPEVTGQAVPYYRARLFALVAVAANFCFRGFWNGVHRPGLYMRTLVIMHVSNVLISYALIFGAFGAPELGSLGAGVGTAIATWIGTVVYIVLAMGHGRGFGFAMPSARPRLDQLRTMGLLALPSSIQQFLFSAGFNVLFFIIGLIGTAELAAANVLMQITLVAILPGLGLGLAAASLVGQALGSGDPDDAKRWGWDVVKLGVVAMGLLGLPMLLAPDAILGVFLPQDPDTIALARLPLRLVGATIWFDGVGMVLLNALLGAGAARAVMGVSVVLQWALFLPAAYLVGPVAGWGLLGVWVAQMVQRMAQAGAFAWLWQRGDWATIKV